MLSREDNELLVRTGPGTPAGALFRRFWTPVLLAAELDGDDRARVDVLGERLVAERGADGTMVLVEASPRRATGRTVVYPARERGGLIWAYLGPADPPPFPRDRRVRSRRCRRPAPLHQDHHEGQLAPADGGRRRLQSRVISA